MSGPVITAWSAISACGTGRAAFEAGGARVSEVEGPDRCAYLASDFVITEALGTKGTASMDRSSGLAAGVVGELLREVVPDARTGVVFGTTSGSAQTQFEFTRDSLTRRKPYFVNPAVMPFALMNSAASQAAIRHRLTGPNTTIGGGRMSGIAVLRYAARLLAAGRASGMVCGAVEEYSPARARLERLRGAGGVLGEGAAALFLEPDGTRREPLAELLEARTRVAVDGDLAGALTACLERVVAGTEVATLVLSAPPGPLGKAELAAAQAVFGELPGNVVNPVDVIGDAGAATGVFAIASALRTPGPAAVTAVDDDGTVGCALLRVCPPA